MKETEKYMDLLYVPHPEPKHHKRMSRANRAAQFAPFAALNGHAAALQETARHTQDRLRLSEDMLESLNEKYRTVKESDRGETTVTIVFFVPDKKKEGGSYQQYSGKIRWIDEEQRVLHFLDGTRISMDDIVDFLE